MAPKPILVVDDSNNIRLTVGKALESLGVPVETTGYAEDALLRLSGGEYAILVLDLELPGMDGMAMLERIGALRPGLPVVIITAYASPEAEAEARRLGAADFVAKPFTPKEIRERVASVLKRSSPEP